MVIVETDRLILRTLEEDDLDRLAAICGDPEVMRFYPAVWGREDAANLIRNHRARQERRGYSLWAVVHRADGRMIGFCGLVEQQVDGVEELEVRYMLDRAYWGQGLATEAARGSRDYAFERLGATRVVSLINPLNAASIRVAEKNGMRHERDAEFRGHNTRVYSVERP